MSRICCVLGHVGSGKTEFAINYAVKEREQGKEVALCDLDVVNPYFRSRERQEFLESLGIRVYSNSFGYDISEDLPAVSAQMKAPFHHPNWVGVYDVGGDNIGARLLNQYKAELDNVRADYLWVVNGNRRESDTLEGAMYHLKEVEKTIGHSITGLVSNTHLMDETTEADIWKGISLCKEIQDITGIPLRHVMGTAENLEKIMEKQQKNTMNLSFFTVKLYLKSNYRPGI